MSQNQEIIEAKLCAYIDGDLDPEGRAEIEKHLEANPQHRRLLESLKATRDLVRWLPRESAPAELAETLNGQLERSVLLDYDGDSLRPRIFPRILAAAAIVVLTAGLAAAVYFALPKSHRNATQIASTNSLRGGDQNRMNEASTAPSEPLGSAADSDSHRDATERFSKGGGTGEVELSKQGSPVAGRAAETQLEHVAHEVAANSDSIVAEANGITPTGGRAAPPLDHAVVMLVRTDKPDAAQKQVTDYLTSNQIEWRSAEPQGQAAGSFDLRNRAEANEAAAARPSASLQQQSQVLARAAGVSPPTRPAQGIAAPQEQPGRMLAQQPGSVQQQSQQAPAAADLTNSLFNNSPGAARANGLYVARMSRTQARALTLTLNQLPQQAAEVKDVLDAGVAAPPAGVELNAATTQPAESFGGANRGVATTQPAVAGGIAADKQAQSKLDAQQLTQSATTLPVRRFRSEALDEKLPGVTQATLPATQPATTEPAGAALSPEEPVNVVIVVEPNAEPPAAANAPAVVPATQPAVPQLAQPIPATQPTTQSAPIR